MDTAAEHLIRKSRVFYLKENFIVPMNYTRSTEDLRHVVRWHYIHHDPSYHNI